ncbi:RIP metalloprotease RseP [Parvibium lacunae]|uniref:Zinc metalloprotease n=1 Tax=Parvibium lacunae TaxID=1888893 RepID=A0A368L7D1_9BURK|nr:RIP metalloprotease RseP [Parvibium lacunae]RCS59575.1 RIP metalloprotease RseP [Parvibium lacunae]
MSTLIAFLLALAILITFHELGHYWIARYCGVKVLRFSFGFGRVLWRYQASPDATEWVISLIPLGGYVKMLDERDPSQSIATPDLPYAFNRQSLGKRAAIVAAGPLANFLLAILLLWLAFWQGTEEPTAIVAAPPPQTIAAQLGLQRGDQISEINGQAVVSWGSFSESLLAAWISQEEIELRWQRQSDSPAQSTMLFSGRWQPESSSVPLQVEPDTLKKLGFVLALPAARVTQVQADSAASSAGLAVGDRILKVADRVPDAEQPLPQLIAPLANRAVTLTLERMEGKEWVKRELTAVPRLDEKTQQGRLGIGIAYDFPTTWVAYPGWLGLIRAWQKTVDMSALTLKLLGKMLTGHASLKNLSGPLTMADAAGQSARISWIAYLSYLAMVSISLAIFNLLPIPLLDGGHLLYYCVEFFTGHPPNEKWLELTQKLGLVLLLGLMSLAFTNDIVRYFF